jgi:hypothetical protein
MHFVLPSLLVDDKGGDGWIGNSNVDDKGVVGYSLLT